MKRALKWTMIGAACGVLLTQFVAGYSVPADFSQISPPLHHGVRSVAHVFPLSR